VCTTRVSLDNVPGLKEHGISVNTVACLMNPPRHKTITAEQYKGLIAACVPGKKNCYHEDSPDQHYLFAQVAYCRELAARFPDEFAMFSCDDMNKIKVGPLAVTRYHQVERFFFPWKTHLITLIMNFLFQVIISFLLNTRPY